MFIWGHIFGSGDGAEGFEMGGMVAVSLLGVLYTCCLAVVLVS